MSRLTSPLLCRSHPDSFWPRSGWLAWLTLVGAGCFSAVGFCPSGSSTTYIAEHAFLYTDVAGMIDLQTLVDPLSAWSLTKADAINDFGQIAGYGTIGGQTHGFLLTPVPEPACITLMTPVAISAILVFLRRCRRPSPLERHPNIV
jgi:probable HAF family extracellular repeat protein